VSARKTMEIKLYICQNEVFRICILFADDCLTLPQSLKFASEKIKIILAGANLQVLAGWNDSTHRSTEMHFHNLTRETGNESEQLPCTGSRRKACTRS
jgi:hypothetical protein